MVSKALLHEVDYRHDDGRTHGFEWEEFYLPFEESDYPQMPLLGYLVPDCGPEDG